MSEGFVYIMVNEAMPGIVKIGRTNRDPEQRARELYQTGVPSPFEVYATVYSPCCEALEASVHKSLSEYRVTAEREFFSISSLNASDALHSSHESQLQEWLDCFLPDHAIIDVDLRVDPSFIEDLASQLGEHQVIVVSALEQLSSAEVRPALARHRASVNERRAKLNSNVDVEADQ